MLKIGKYIYIKKKDARKSSINPKKEEKKEKKNPCTYLLTQTQFLFVQSFWYLCFGAVFILILLFKMSPFFPFLRHLILSFDFTASLKSILKKKPFKKPPYILLFVSINLSHAGAEMTINTSVTVTKSGYVFQ